MKPSFLACASLLPLVLVCGLSRAAGSSGAEEESLIDSLSWMEGRWVIDGGGQYIEETWGPSREDAMVGSLRWSREGGVWLYELMAIEADEEHGLVFLLRHFDRGLEPWKSEKAGPLTFPLYDVQEKRVVFENPERDDPRRVVYERKEDALLVSIEGPEEGSAKPFVFRLDP